MNTTWRFIYVCKNYDILHLVVTMKITHIFLLTIFLFLFSGCQTIENKSQKAIKKENEKLSKFIGQPESELKIVLGNPDEARAVANAGEQHVRANHRMEQRFGVILEACVQRGWLRSLH